MTAVWTTVARLFGVVAAAAVLPGCVAYEPAPSYAYGGSGYYYPPSYSYYPAPAYGPSLGFSYTYVDRDRGWYHGWRDRGWYHDR